MRARLAAGMQYANGRNTEHTDARFHAIVARLGGDFLPVAAFGSAMLASDDDVPFTPDDDDEPTGIMHPLPCTYGRSGFWCSCDIGDNRDDDDDYHNGCGCSQDSYYRDDDDDDAIDLDRET